MISLKVDGAVAQHEEARGGHLYGAAVRCCGDERVFFGGIYVIQQHIGCLDQVRDHQ